ncbi:dTDP-4-dehydrorhamnose reductase [Flagellimonas nanhaiensis]|uniref:dTDP-4-dehydrorhamnose reductase n=1 Tax=Flagellimonas nanhaiensis TaxID=2292706 RepID=A0A371JLH3_9FLAO|nr:dTDP-4-dehydrorhamnose reductase [Allomuricauda nanhaiensis]RDY57861.1 dTDP-4-dehydrorhamnose reductase [Allomuricauda nanhaiensis]
MKSTIKVLVTGALGQLASSIKLLADQGQTKGLDLVFKTEKELDITDFEAVEKEFKSSNYAYCVNCAGYTAVDKAETEKEIAHQVNVVGARNLAITCKENKVTLIHISTDFIFDGFQETPYVEDDIARPISVYGDTKYKGEQAIVNNTREYFILRTSWLYSEFGHNFMKTMIRLGNERKELSVVFDQVGTPTYALDLAKVIVHLIETENTEYGVYHYSNEGVASWYDFAKTIFDGSNITIDLKPIRSEVYPQPAQRPKFSVLDKSKIKNTFGIEIPHWKDSLQQALEAVNNLE